MDERTYETLFIDLDWYTLPDGTLVQALWTGMEPPREEPVPDPYWILTPEQPDNTLTRYDVERDGSIIGVRAAGDEDTRDEPTPTERWHTGLTADDLRPEQA